MSLPSRIIFAIFGVSSSAVLLSLTGLRKRQAKKVAEERLRMINKALEQAEERVARLQDRHDRLLDKICSLYLCHRELEEALLAARKALDDAFDFVACLRKMQLWSLSSYPNSLDLANALS